MEAMDFQPRAIAFFKDSHGMLTYGREYLGNTREPYAITVVGERLYIISSPKDVSAVYKTVVTLTFDEYIRGMMYQFGGSEDAVQKMWQNPGKDGNGKVLLSPNPFHKNLAKLAADFYWQQLHPGTNLEELQNQFMPNIHKSLNYENISENSIISSTTGEKTVSLLGWVREVLLGSATKAFFGDRLLQIEPKMFQSFFDFDDNSWKLTYHLPRMFAKEIYGAKQQATEALVKYFQTPKEERPGAAWIIQTLESEMRNLGIKDPDIACFLMMIYWVFFFFYFREEIGPVVEEGLTGLEYRLEHCARLDSVYNEVLRLTASSSSVRTVLSTVYIGGKQLRSGTKVLIPYRQLHFNEDVWGTDAKIFDPERFLKDKRSCSKLQLQTLWWRHNLLSRPLPCKTRSHDICLLALHRFDITLAANPALPASKDKTTKPAFPRLEEQKPCLDIMGPANGHDVCLKVRPAKRLTKE